MAQFNGLRQRFEQFSPRARWVQMGLVTASVMTPLLSRWNDLRAADRARLLREEAEARLGAVRTLTARQRDEALDQVNELLRRAGAKTVDTQLAKKSKATSDRSRAVASTLWLIGVGVGLVAAGAGAYVLVRRRIDHAADSPLLDLPLGARNGHDTRYGDDASTLRELAQATATAQRQTVGASTNAQHDAPAYISTEVPLASTATAAPMGVSATPMPSASAAAMPATPVDNADAVVSTEAPVDGAATDGVGVVDADLAPFIGNIRTMIYHEADAPNLPAEDNRVYFVSEDEAHAAGYRRDHSEQSA